jgi:hypothetical protein
MKALTWVVGRARSRSMGTEGAEALPLWDPSTSWPRWLLNTTCRAPSSWWTRGLVDSRSGSNARTLVVPDSVNLGRLFEPFKGQDPNP